MQRGGPPHVSEVILKSSDSLERIYRTKCTALGLTPSQTITDRLALYEATRSKAFAMVAVPMGSPAEFKVLLDVMAMATGVVNVDLSHCSLGDAHMEEFVHYVVKHPQIRSIALTNNRGIADKGGQYLLDLAEHCQNITRLDVEHTSISEPLMANIQRVVESNSVHAASSLLDIPNDRDSDSSSDLGSTWGQHRTMSEMLGANGAGGDDSMGSLVSATHTLFGQTNAEASGLSVSQLQSESNGTSRETLSVVMVSTVMLYDSVLRAVESILVLLCWERPWLSMSVLSSLVMCAQAEQLTVATLLVAGVSVIRGSSRPLTRKVEERALRVDVKGPVRLLEEVRRIRWMLSGKDANQLADGLYELVALASDALAASRSREGSRLLGGMVLLTAVWTLFVPIKHVMTFVAICAFGYGPVALPAVERLTSDSTGVRRLLIRALDPSGTIVVDAGNRVEAPHSQMLVTTPPHSPRHGGNRGRANTLGTRRTSGSGPEGGLARQPSISAMARSMSMFGSFRMDASAAEEPSIFSSPFAFRVVVEKLIDCSAHHTGGRQFVPLVHVRYRDTSWVSAKSHRPWVWNEGSDTLRFVPGSTKLSFHLYDDATDVFGAVSEGNCFLDDTVAFDRPLSVRLRAAKTEKSLLRDLVSGIQDQERASKRRFGLADVGGRGGQTHGRDLRMERPGFLVVRLQLVDDEYGPTSSSLNGISSDATAFDSRVNSGADMTAADAMGMGEPEITLTCPSPPHSASPCGSPPVESLSPLSLPPRRSTKSSAAHDSVPMASHRSRESIDRDTPSAPSTARRDTQVPPPVDVLYRGQGPKLTEEALRGQHKLQHRTNADLSASFGPVQPSPTASSESNASRVTFKSGGSGFVPRSGNSSVTGSRIRRRQ